MKMTRVDIQLVAWNEVIKKKKGYRYMSSSKEREKERCDGTIVEVIYM